MIHIGYKRWGEGIMFWVKLPDREKLPAWKAWRKKNPLGRPLSLAQTHISGAIAQLGERDNGIVEVGSSILPGSKNIGSYARSKNHPRRTKCA